MKTYGDGNLLGVRIVSTKELRRYAKPKSGTWVPFMLSALENGAIEINFKKLDPKNPRAALRRAMASMKKTIDRRGLGSVIELSPSSANNYTLFIENISPKPISPKEAKRMLYGRKAKV